MAGIYRYKHKIEVQNSDMAKVFGRIHPEYSVKKVESTDHNTVLIDFVSSQEISEEDRISILTFGGRPLIDGIQEGYTSFNQ